MTAGKVIRCTNMASEPNVNVYSFWQIGTQACFSMFVAMGIMLDTLPGWTSLGIHHTSFLRINRWLVQSRFRLTFPSMKLVQVMVTLFYHANITLRTDRRRLSQSILLTTIIRLPSQPHNATHPSEMGRLHIT